MSQGGRARARMQQLDPRPEAVANAHDGQALVQEVEGQPPTQQPAAPAPASAQPAAVQPAPQPRTTPRALNRNT